MLMPAGKFAGQPVKAMSTAFLAWTISQDAIRHARPELVEHIVGVLAERFHDRETLLAELRVTETPAARWRSPEKAAKLASKEARHQPAARLRKADPNDISDLL